MFIDTMPDQEAMMKRHSNNAKLRAPGQPIPLTNDQVQEWARCKQDPIYFIETYVKIVHVDHGLIPFKLRPFQKELINKIHANRFVIAKVSRQVGKSISIVGEYLHQTIFFDSMNMGIFANKGDNAKSLLARYHLAYEHLPLWMQQGVVEWNKHSIHLENGSKILATATSASAGRSGSFNCILLDEFAFVDRHIADDFFTSAYPTISSGKTTKIIIISTPHGMNLFHKFWTEAKEGRNGYVTVEGNWTADTSRDEAWMQQEIAILGEENFRQEHECDFIGSQNTLIAPKKLKELVYIKPMQETANLSVYENPKENNIYIITVDSSRGQNLDYSAFSVIDASQSPYKQVAKFRDKKMDPSSFPTYIFNAAKRYNDAYVLVENNDIGSQVVTSLHEDLEYENIFCTSPKGRGGQQISSGFKKGARLGVRMSAALKKVACANLKTLIETDKLITKDFETISELTTFVADKVSFAAENGCNDDMVMTLALFAWVTTQPLFKEITDMDMRKQMINERLGSIQADLIPFGIISDGNPEPEQFVDRKGDLLWEVDENYPGYYDEDFD